MHRIIQILLLPPIFLFILTYYLESTCGRCPTYRGYELYSAYLLLYLGAFSIPTFLIWSFLHSDRLGKILVLILSVFSSIALGLLMYDDLKSDAKTITLRVLSLVIPLLIAAVIYYPWKEKLKKIRVYYFLLGFLTFVFFVAPIPVRCNTVVSCGEDYCGITDPCYSIFSQKYWEYENKPGWKVFIFRTTLYHELREYLFLQKHTAHNDDVILYD